MKKRLKVNGLIIIVAAVLIAAYPSVFFRRYTGNSLEAAIRVCGIAFIILGQIFRVCARGYKSEYSRNGHALIQGGPYQLVRNPMYLGILLIGLGVVLVLFQWWAVLVFIVVFIMRYILLIFTEEKKLLGLFPKAYQEYCVKVPRILPSFIALVKTDVSRYLPLKLSWLKGEVGSMLAVLFITLLLASWQVVRVGGLKPYIVEAGFIGGVILFFIVVMAYLIKRTQDQD